MADRICPGKDTAMFDKPENHRMTVAFRAEDGVIAHREDGLQKTLLTGTYVPSHECPRCKGGEKR